MTKIMGIVNVTPDSFWSGSRLQDKEELLQWVRRILSQGADVLDVGGCSTRPDSPQATEQEEMSRLEWGLTAIREEFPQVPVSVDTYRPRIAHRCVKEWNVSIINDVYGGNSDMYDVVAETGAQYVLTWAEKVVQDPVAEMNAFFRERLRMMEQAGVDVAHKVILDPGFGFGKKLEDNYTVLAHMDTLGEFGLPVLAGMSRKSMAYRMLGLTPADVLPATIVLDTVAVQKGASWLRVHDVEEAAQTLKILKALEDNK